MTDSNLWYRWLGRFNRTIPHLLRIQDNDGVRFNGVIPDCEICPAGNTHQPVHLKGAYHKTKLFFELVFTDVMGPIMLRVLRGYKYVSKISGQHTEWVETYLLKFKDGAFSTFKYFA